VAAGAAFDGSAVLDGAVLAGVVLADAVLAGAAVVTNEGASSLQRSTSRLMP
jgi:hypothetical protein